VIQLLLGAATAALVIAVGDPRRVLTRSDLLVTTWALTFVVWPIVAIFLVAPLLWSTSEDAGGYFALLEYFPALAWSGLALVTAMTHERLVLNSPALVTGVPLLFSVTWLFLADASSAPQVVLAFAFFAGVAVKVRRTSIHTVGYLCALSLCLISASVLLSALVVPEKVLASCRADKCGLASEVITSPFAGNGNVLGLAMVILVPLTFAAITRWRVVSVVIGATIVVVLADSRTALFGLLLALVVLGMILIAPSDGSRRTVALVGLFVSAAASALPFLLRFSRLSFSYRRDMWQIATDLVQQLPLFGHGPDYWSLMGESTLYDANYSPHNGWLDMLVGIGLVGTAFIVMGVVYQFYETASRAFPHLAAYYCGVLAVNTFESVYVPYYVGILPFVALLPLMVYDPRPSVHGVGEGRMNEAVNLPAEARLEPPASR
jgi:O-antigen ligase